VTRRFSTLLLAAGLFLPLGCHTSTAGPGSATLPLETHYAPAENLERIDRDLLASAHRSIDLCAYSLTDHVILEAIQGAAQHGVRVRIYLDRVQTEGELKREQRRPAKASDNNSRADSEDNDGDLSGGVLASLNHTTNITVRIKHSRTLMHLKSYAIDGSLLRSGSANFSPTGEKRQDNDLTITHDPAAIDRFERNFESIWGRPDNDPLP